MRIFEYVPPLGVPDCIEWRAFKDSTFHTLFKPSIFFRGFFVWIRNIVIFAYQNDVGNH
jgi:hypothetical protein